ncbi:MAG: hypothetical protein JSW09_03935 [Pseudomonadota bacterium]|nr:MAG: hypothetical protein JSW09_03935 [Pseudomonadota bacterium]
MLQRLIRRQRSIGRHLLAAFLAFWAVAAVTPCVLAAAQNSPVHGGLCKLPDCPTLAKIDCQASNQKAVKFQVTTAADNTLSFVPWQYLAPVSVDATRPPQTRHAAASIPRPPIILQYVIMLT